MGIWIELHCDKQAPVSDATGRYNCVSGRGEQPGQMTLRRPAEVVRSMIKQALKDGWVREGDKLICPVCAAYWRSQAGKEKR